MRKDPYDNDYLYSTLQTYKKLAANINSVVAGQERAVRLLLSAFLTGGHVLLEDFPGTGKTTLAKVLAGSCGIRYQRVQFTSDLLPTDLLGASIYNQERREFTFRKGPLFTNILLADEINRASPKTQSALLEAMAESQISVDGHQFILHKPFFVIATQNPYEFLGTYPLPESQMDRFALKLHLGYLSILDEVRIIGRDNDKILEQVETVVTADDILQFKRNAADITVTDDIKRYIVEIVAATRKHKKIGLPASPRASLTLLRCSQALAVFDGIDFVTPDHIQEIAIPAIAHRIGVKTTEFSAGTDSNSLITELLESIPPPR